MYEGEVRTLREEAAWLEGHSVTRTVRWVRSRLFIMACFVVTAMALISWSFTATGRAVRVGWAMSLQVASDSTLVQVDGSALIIRDIPQREIDSFVADIRSDQIEAFGH